MQPMILIIYNDISNENDDTYFMTEGVPKL